MTASAAYLKAVTEIGPRPRRASTAPGNRERRATTPRPSKPWPSARPSGASSTAWRCWPGFEFMSERLAVALDSGDQEDEHSCFSDTTKQDFVHDLEGIERVWTGARGRRERWPRQPDVDRSAERCQGSIPCSTGLRRCQTKCSPGRSLGQGARSAPDRLRRTREPRRRDRPRRPSRAD